MKGDMIFIYHNGLMEYNEDKNIIDEIIESLGVENLEDIKNIKELDVAKSNSMVDKPKEEYEIVMNCDDSNYIIYYKK